MDNFWVHYKTGLFLGVISIHLRDFLKVNIQNWKFFFFLGGGGGFTKFQIFSGYA